MRNHRRSPFQRSNRAPRNATETEVFLYDQIGFFGISAEQFVKDLRGINSATIAVRINSPGGAVFEGVAIMNAIREHPARITAHIDGLAASIASDTITQERSLEFDRMAGELDRLITDNHNLREKMVRMSRSGQIGTKRTIPRGKKSASKAKNN